jgi:DNA-binding NarL/FixJ family response regulator
VERTLLVEDHASFCHTLAVVFDGEPEFKILAQTDTAAGACEVLDGLGGHRRESIRR